MKLKITKRLKKALQFAASNSCEIASGILNELQKNVPSSEIINSIANYFDIQYELSGFQREAKISGCSKDLKNKNFPDRDNPNAPYLLNNRTEYTPNTFVKLFKNLPEYTEKQLNFFSSAIELDAKVTIYTASNLIEMIEAYDYKNYYPFYEKGEATLYHSCMKYSYKANFCADFYKNFANAKIIVAKDDEDRTLGRAILWENAYLPSENIYVSFMDRIYSSYDFVRKLIIRYARENGVNFKRRYNSSDNEDEITVLNPIGKYEERASHHQVNMEILIKDDNKFFQDCFPYLDTFFTLNVNPEGFLFLSNYASHYYIARLRSTEGGGELLRHHCMICSKIISYSVNGICDDCKDKYSIQTKCGTTWLCKFINYKGDLYPDILFTKGKPNRHLKTFVLTNNLMED